MINMVKLPTKKSDLFLRVAKGHFATSHSHINYYIDVTKSYFEIEKEYMLLMAGLMKYSELPASCN